MDTETHRLAKMFTAAARDARVEGYVLNGSVVKRHLVRSRGDKEKRYGPYYLWTRKKEGKTITIALNSIQARAIGEAIRRQRSLDLRLAKLRALSERIIFLISAGVSRRNRRKQAG